MSADSPYEAVASGLDAVKAELRRLRQERDTAREHAQALAEQLRPFVPTKHPTTCPMHVMHDWFYDPADPDYHQQASLPIPRKCDCGYDSTRAALHAAHEAGVVE